MTRILPAARLLGIAAFFALPALSRAETFEASIAIDPGKTIGRIDPGIYGQYLEHVQEEDECIYPSIWDDTSPFADENGVRLDVAAAAKEMDPSVVRWPGGCFADVYHWENGIGPSDKRPTLPNKHWKGKESHKFGTDEFLRWCKLAGAVPYINVNLGSGTLDEALRWLEYCNGSPGTEQGKRRAANGHPEPYGVTFWGIGNETWGPWETGHTDAATYSKMLAEWAEAMRRKDSSIQILGVGSNTGKDPKWDAEVVGNAGHLIDFLTLHVYGASVGPAGEGYEGVAYTPDYFDFSIKRMLRTIDTTQAKAGRKRDIRISVDEWNIRHYEGNALKRRDPRNLQDAVFAAGVLNVFIRNSPRVAMANHVFLVNGHAPLLVNREMVVKTPYFHLFRQYGKWMKGTALAVATKSPVCDPPAILAGGPKAPPTRDYKPGPHPYLDATSALHDDGTLVVTLINRHRTDSADVSLSVPAGYRAKKAWTLSDEDLGAANDFDNPHRVMPREEEIPEPAKTWRCAPHSIVMLSFSKEG